MPRERKLCWTGPVVSGIDVSYAQGRIDWDEVAASGLVDYAIIRTGDGLITDRRFDYNWREAGRVGLRRGTYHYLRMQHDGAEQARISSAAIERAGGLAWGDLPPAVDVEWGHTEESYNRFASPEEIVGTTKAFIAEMERLQRRKPIVYSGGYWRDRVAARRPDLADAVSDYPLWRAHPGAQCPNVTPGWDRWTFWQWSWDGAIPGVRTRVDLDVFAGDKGDLRRLIWQSRIIPWWGWGLAAAALAGAGYGTYYFLQRYG